MFFMTAEQQQTNHACAFPQSGVDEIGASGYVEGDYWRWCPRCGHELHNERCKLRCPRCHYFMSCSDFD